MMRRLTITCVAWVLLSAFSDPPPDGFKAGNEGAIIHEKSGYVFPPSLLGFEGKNEFIIKYQNPNDISIGYNYFTPMTVTKNRSPDIAATIYIYKSRYEGEADINKVNTDAMRELATIHNNALLDLTTVPVRGKCGEKDITGVYDTFKIDSIKGNNGRAALSEVYIFIQEPWIIKIRLTNKMSTPETSLAFVKSFFAANENHPACK